VVAALDKIVADATNADTYQELAAALDQMDSATQSECGYS
jgi:hypothetical protein